MNKAEARARWSPMGCWIGEFRFVHKAEFYPVTNRGEPERFPTAMAAELAAYKAVVAHLNGHMTRSGERAVMQAERAFDAIFTGGKKIPVETKGKRRAGK